MGATAEAPKVDLRADSGAELPPGVAASGPFERVALALKVAAFALVPTATLGVVFAFAVQLELLGLLFVEAALIYAVAISGSSVIMRWLTLGASPFPDRAATAPVWAVAHAATAECTLRMFDGGAVAPFVGAAITIPFVGILGICWSVAAPFLARDGEAKRQRKQWRIRDLSIALALVGLYATAFRWLTSYAELDDWENVRMILYYGALAVGVGFATFLIDLVCRIAARSKRRWIFAMIGILPFLGGLIWSIAELMTTNNLEPIAPLIAVGLSCYLVLAAILAGLAEWRPLLPTLRRLDRARRSKAIRAEGPSPVIRSADE